MSTMTLRQKRGRIYVAAFVAALVILDLALKAFLLSSGSLRWSQAVGSVITLITCWFLWRGSKFAYRFMLLCLTLAAMTVFALASILTNAGMASLLLLLGLFSLALVAPATRSFLAYQRGVVPNNSFKPKPLRGSA